MRANVLNWLDALIDDFDGHPATLISIREAVAELIAADREYDAALRQKCELLTESALSRFSVARDRREAALIAATGERA